HSFTHSLSLSFLNDNNLLVRASCCIFAIRHQILHRKHGTRPRISHWQLFSKSKGSQTSTRTPKEGPSRYYPPCSIFLKPSLIPHNLPLAAESSTPAHAPTTPFTVPAEGISKPTRRSV